jgi:hypothetical protein
MPKTALSSAGRGVYAVSGVETGETDAENGVEQRRARGLCRSGRRNHETDAENGVERRLREIFMKKAHDA